MPVASFLKRFSNLIGFQVPSGRVRPKRGRTPPSAVRERLAASTGGTVVGGVVELLGLPEIKDRLGQDWEIVASTVDEIVTGEFAQLLDGADVHERSGTDYVICFDHATKAEAKRTVTALARMIEHRLVEQAAILGVNVMTHVDKVAADTVLAAKDVPTAMKQALLAGRSAGPAAKRVPAAPTILFQPIWPSGRWSRAQNRCVLDSISGVAIARQFEELGGAAELERAVGELDCLLLAETILALQRGPTVSRDATVLVPVHFHSLLGPAGLEIVSRGAALEPHDRRSIALDVIGVPAAAGARDLLQAARTAREAVDAVIMQIHPGDGRCRKPLVEQLAGASMHFEGPAEEVNHRELQTFAAHCAELGLLSYAYGANTIGRAVGAVQAGFDYVAGAAVQNMSPTPRPHSGFVPLFGNAVPERQDGTTEERRLSSRFTPTEPNCIMQLPSGERVDCIVENASGSGAALTAEIRPPVGTDVQLGRLEARVIRHTDQGFVVRFVRLHPASVVEAALKATSTRRSR